MEETKEHDAVFYIKASPEKENIEIIDNIEMSNEFKQYVCIPYFQDIFSVFMKRIWPTNQNQKEKGFRGLLSLK